MIIQGVVLISLDKCVMHNKISPNNKQIIWFLWHFQCNTWWLAGNKQLAAKVAIRKITLIAKPIGYNINRKSEFTEFVFALITTGFVVLSWHVNILGCGPEIIKGN